MSRLCPICREDNGEHLTVLKCSHVYHEECITTWMNKGNNCCPICNEVVEDSGLVKWYNNKPKGYEE